MREDVVFVQMTREKRDEKDEMMARSVLWSWRKHQEDREGEESLNSRKAMVSVWVERKRKVRLDVRQNKLFCCSSLCRAVVQNKIPSRRSVA